MLRPAHLLRYFLLSLVLGVLLVATGVWGTGDFGLVQRWLTKVEQRALAGRSTPADRGALRLLYQGLALGGRAAYPQAAGLLEHYLQGSGDTLRFDARPLLRHPEVQRALQQGKPGITFRHSAGGTGPFYVARRTDWPLYYAFDLLYIRQRGDSTVFYDNYFFQPLARRSRTRFHLGKVSFNLNDGLVRVAYPQAKSFVAYGSVARVKTR